MTPTRFGEVRGRQGPSEESHKNRSSPVAAFQTHKAMLSYLPTATPCPQQFPWRAVPSSFHSTESLHFKVQLHRGTSARLHLSLTMYFTHGPGRWTASLPAHAPGELGQVQRRASRWRGEPGLARRPARGRAARPRGWGRGGALDVEVRRRASALLRARGRRGPGRRARVRVPKLSVAEVHGPGLAGGNRAWGGPRGGWRASVGTRQVAD